MCSDNIFLWTIHLLIISSLLPFSLSFLPLLNHRHPPAPCYPLPSQFQSFFPIFTSLKAELCGSCIIDRHLHLWHLLLLSSSPFSPPLSIKQCASGLMQPGRYLGQHQSLIHTHINCAYTPALPKCLCMGHTGVVEGGEGREENKNNFSSPFPPL